MSTLGERAVSFGLKLVAALAILSIVLWLTKRLMNMIRRGMERRKLEASLMSFLLSFLNILFKVFVVVICLTTVGVQMTSIVAVLGGGFVSRWYGVVWDTAKFCGRDCYIAVQTF